MDVESHSTAAERSAADGALPVPYFSVCIITYRRPGLLAKCLERISPGRQTLEPSTYEVVVSDDCSEGSAREVVEQSGFARWVRGPGRGVAANRNRVAQAARGEWIVFVDDDELPESVWLEKLHEAAVSGNWDVIEGRVEPVDYPDSVFWYAPTVPWGGIFCTANLAIRRKLLFELGGFDETLTVSHEDMELGSRVKQSGASCTFLPEALVRHPARPLSFGQLWKRLLQQQCQSFELQHPHVHPGKSKRCGCLYLAAWSARFWMRCVRIQLAVERDGQWRRLVQENFLRALAGPVAAVKLWRGQRAQPASDQKL